VSNFLIEGNAVHQQAGNLQVSVDDLREILERYRAAVEIAMGAWFGLGSTAFRTFNQQFQQPAQALIESLQVMQGEVDAAGTAYDQNETAQQATVTALGGFLAPMTLGAGQGGARVGERVPNTPEVGTDPYAAAEWWATLTPEQQQALIQAEPDRIGALDGLPASVRHEANMLVLNRELAETSAELPHLEGEELAEATRRLEMLEAVQAQVTASPDRTLLLLDTSGEGRAAIGIGDVDTAEHVAVVVPGFDTEVGEDLDNIVANAQRLQDTAVELSPTVANNEDVATIAWLGYEPPLAPPDASVADTAFDGRAQAGAGYLDPTLNGLQAARDAAQANGTAPDLHLTLVGHSYGSLTSGITLQGDTPVDDAVFIGSPGVDSYTAGALNVPEGHVFVGEAEGDYVADLNHFARDPGYEQFGARRFETGEVVDPTTGEALQESTGHSQYFHTGTSSLQNEAYITLGRDDLIIPSESREIGDPVDYIQDPRNPESPFHPLDPTNPDNPFVPTNPDSPTHPDNPLNPNNHPLNPFNPDSWFSDPPWAGDGEVGRATREA
jgi:uncharacterized protein YukE